VTGRGALALRIAPENEKVRLLRLLERRARSERRWASASLWIGAAIVGGIAIVAIFAPLITAHGPSYQDLLNPLQPPSWSHPLGTDNLGRDILTRVIYAGRIDLTVGLVTTYAPLLIGVLLGLLAGYRGGWVDTVLMRAVDVMFAFPVLLLALAVVAILGPGTTTTILAIGIVYTPIFARVARASTLSVRVEPFVQMSHAMGTGNLYILARHIVPNIAGPLIVQTSLSLAFAILSEAALSFLGLGIQPPRPSLGRMIFDSQGFVTMAWWMAVFPGATIFVIVLAFNLAGDGLRDVLDPKQRTMIEARSKQ
jgi:peptide/nickel transport system permease protein